MKRTLTIVSLIAWISTSSYASIVYLPTSATTVGGWEDQSFISTINSKGMVDASLNPVTIVSGTTTLEDAGNYLARTQYWSPSTGHVPGRWNGRFNGSFGTVTYAMDTVDLDGFLLWNYNEYYWGGDYNERGLLSADITILHDSGTAVLNDVPFLLTPETSGPDDSIAQQVSFGATYSGVTEITFSDIVSGDSQFVGWNQVAAYQIPEPATLGLLGLFAGGIFFVRHFFVA